METLPFTVLESNDDELVATGEYHGRLSLIKVENLDEHYRVTVEVDGTVVKSWEAPPQPREQVLADAQDIALAYMQ
jgi:hypothetical protein